MRCYRKMTQVTGKFHQKFKNLSGLRDIFYYSELRHKVFLFLSSYGMEEWVMCPFNSKGGCSKQARCLCLAGTAQQLMLESCLYAKRCENCYIAVQV